MRRITRFLVPLALSAGLAPDDALGQCVPVPDGLVAWWPFEGDAAEIDGRFESSLMGGASFVEGKVGLGLELDGIDDFVLVPSDPEGLLDLTGDLSVSLWARRKVPVPSAVERATCMMISKGAGISAAGVDVPTAYLMWFYGFDGHAVEGLFETADGTNVTVRGPPVTDGDFHHYAYTREASVHTLYMDGTFVASAPFSVGPGSARSLPLTIGAQLGNPSWPTDYGAFFGGILDEVMIFSRALADSEVLAIFEADAEGVCEAGPGLPVFVRADSNSDGNVDLSDAVFTLGNLFVGGPGPTCLAAADADDTGVIEITDAIYSLSFLFLGGTPPPAPYPECGEDPTDDDLGCESFAGCP